MVIDSKGYIVVDNPHKLLVLQLSLRDEKSASGALMARGNMATHLVHP